MNKNDSLGDRMKEYESVTQSKVMKRTPTLIRLDGKSFHTFTKQINKQNDSSLLHGPFSEKLHWVMKYTTQQLFNHIQNVKFAYTQSDEITLLLTDWNTLQTDQWFGGKIQKIASVSASIATAYFNRYFPLVFDDIVELEPAFFDSRVFNIPKEEVANNFIWRQHDCTRNSVNMLGQFYFSHKQLHGKKCNEVQDMLMLEHNVNWNNLADWKKRGTCVYSAHSNVVIDENIPVFTQDRNFIEKFLD